MQEEEPNLITSSKSQRVLVDGYPFSIEIFRLEHDTTWTLQVVDPDNASHVWDEQFSSDKDARDEELRSLEREGALAFMRGGGNVVQFPVR